MDVLLKLSSRMPHGVCDRGYCCSLTRAAEHSVNSQAALLQAFRKLYELSAGDAERMQLLKRVKGILAGALPWLLQCQAAQEASMLQQY